MRRLSLIILHAILSLAGFSQTADYTHMVKVQEENDFLNLIGNRTDRSYTNGTRIGYFYLRPWSERDRRRRFLPTAGDSSLMIHGWSVAQYMVTPDDITKTTYQANDYPYAGALTVTRSFFSFNPSKKFSYETEFLVGIRGRHAFAKQTQTWIHAMINSARPLGWQHQLESQLLVNITFTAERNLISWDHFLELNGGVEARIGSFMDAVLVYPILRFGKMRPYFDGFLPANNISLDRRKNQWQYFLVIKPAAAFVAYNSMIKGHPGSSDAGRPATSVSPSHYVADIQWGATIIYRNFSLAYFLTRSTSYDKGLYEHRYGCIEIGVRW